jgi:hypothetical protein
MSSWRFESETAAVFDSEISLERLHTKNVIELSVLREGKRSRIRMNKQRFDGESKARPRIRDLAFV